MKQPTDTEMLDWVAKYVTEINWVGMITEVLANDEGDIRIFRQKGCSVKSFRSCIQAGMKRWPIKPPTTKRRKSK